MQLVHVPQPRNFVHRAAHIIGAAADRLTVLACVCVVSVCVCLCVSAERRRTDRALVVFWLRGDVHEGDALTRRVPERVACTKHNNALLPLVRRTKEEQKTKCNQTEENKITASMQTNVAPTANIL